MKRIFAGKSTVCSALTWTLLASLLAAGPACPAQSNPSLDKHARKVQEQLIKYPAGTYVNLAFRDGTQDNGVLGALTSTSFAITNADNNARETHLYTEVASVQRDKEYIGEGSGPRHHFRMRLWVPVVAGAAAAGAAVAFAVR